MFLTGPEIKEHYAPGPGERSSHGRSDGKVEPVHEMWDRKLQESKESHPRYGHAYGDYESHDSGTLEEDIARHGIQHPVGVGRSDFGNRDTLYNGHHRVAVAVANHPNMLIPVKHIK